MAEAAGLEILRWGSSAKHVVRPVVVESVCEGVDEGLELVDSVRQDVVEENKAKFTELGGSAFRNRETTQGTLS